MKMVWETQKIFEDENLLVNPTAVRIPVVYGHSEAVHIETKEKISANDARHLLEKADGVIVMDERSDGGYATAFSEATNNDATYVSRIREDISHDKGLNLWVVSDNIRKGAALNTIQIAEILIRDYIA
jgi:aspartate-semialdehyde dehydrogenase